jgi:hypothetical protein
LWWCRYVGKWIAGQKHGRGEYTHAAPFGARVADLPLLGGLAEGGATDARAAAAARAFRRLEAKKTGFRAAFATADAEAAAVVSSPRPSSWHLLAGRATEGEGGLGAYLEGVGAAVEARKSNTESVSRSSSAATWTGPGGHLLRAAVKPRKSARSALEGEGSDDDDDDAVEEEDDTSEEFDGKLRVLQQMMQGDEADATAQPDALEPEEEPAVGAGATESTAGGGSDDVVDDRPAHFPQPFGTPVPLDDATTWPVEASAAPALPVEASRAAAAATKHRLPRMPGATTAAAPPDATPQTSMEVKAARAEALAAQTAEVWHAPFNSDPSSVRRNKQTHTHAH